MMKIVFKNGEVIKYKRGDYTTYDLRRDYFLVYYQGQCIGIYNMDGISFIDVEKVGHSTTMMF